VNKIKNALGLAADLAPGATLIIVGLSVAIGGATGALWL
jgi:hypothetical protein